jgi:RND family efflux transporter MFP subunit
VALLLVILWPGLQATDAELSAPADGAAAHPVRVMPARLGTDPPLVRLPGVVRARERGDLAFLHSGHLAERRVQRGQQVEAGEILAVLHNPSLMPGAEAAAARAREAQLTQEQLEREVVRLQDLAARDLVPTEELERIVSRRDSAVQASNQAQAALGEAREQLDEAMLRAPYGGTIGLLMVEPGQFVAPGQPILSLIGDSGLETAVHLPSDQAARLSIGRTVTVEVPGDALQSAGVIREVSATGPGQVAEIIIDLEADSVEAVPMGEQLRSGQAVEVILPLDAAARLSVPMAALTQSSSGLARVFRVENGRAIAVDVRPGRLRGGWLGVEGELAEGDLIVVAGHGRLLHDDAVRIVQ